MRPPAVQEATTTLSKTWHETSQTAPQTQHKVQGGLFLDVVVRQGPPVLQLLARKDQALLIRGDAFLVLNLSFYIVNRVRCLNIEGDGLARQGLHKDLHAAPQTQHKVQGGLLLDVVVRQGPPVLQLLARKDQALLIRGDAFLVLNL